MGINSFIIQGYRTSRSRKRHSYFQPLSIVDIVFIQKESRGLQKITESKLNFVLQDVQTHPVKLSLGLAILEIFYDTVKEQEQNIELYEFLKSLIKTLDQAHNRLIQLFIYFLIHHTRYLGFFPHDQSEGGTAVSFNTRKGTLTKADGGSGDTSAYHVRQFIHSSLSLLPASDSCQQITFDQLTKRQMITDLFQYYRHHIEGFKYPQTMKVFAEVFG